jgi:hypothetical protein
MAFKSINLPGFQMKASQKSFRRANPHTRRQNPPRVLREPVVLEALVMHRNSDASSWIARPAVQPVSQFNPVVDQLTAGVTAFLTGSGRRFSRPGDG